MTSWLKKLVLVAIPLTMLGITTSEEANAQWRARRAVRQYNYWNNGGYYGGYYNRPYRGYYRGYYSRPYRGGYYNNGYGYGGYYTYPSYGYYGGYYY